MDFFYDNIFPLLSFFDPLVPAGAIMEVHDKRPVLDHLNRFTPYLAAYKLINNTLHTAGQAMRRYGRSYGYRGVLSAPFRAYRRAFSWATGSRPYRRRYSNFRSRSRRSYY